MYVRPVHSNLRITFPMPVSGNLVRGVLVSVSVVLVTKLFLGKNTINPPSSFINERPSEGARVNRHQHAYLVTNNRLLYTTCYVCI